MSTTEPSGAQKQMLGERLYPLVSQMQPELAGEITGMLLDIDNTELLHLLEFRESLEAKVKEAIAVLLIGLYTQNINMMFQTRAKTH